MQVSGLRARPRQAEYVVLMDANAHLGSVCTESVAEAGAEEESTEGEYCHDFLLQVGAFLPATQPTVHSGQHWTWAAPRPSTTRHRIDYVAAPQEWRCFDISSWVWHQFEALQAREDHLPVCLTVAFSHTVPDQELSQRAVCRPQLPTCVEDALKCQQALQDIPAIPWAIPVDAHNAYGLRISSKPPPFFRHGPLGLLPVPICKRPPWTWYAEEPRSESIFMRKKPRPAGGFFSYVLRPSCTPRGVRHCGPRPARPSPHGSGSWT